jgi:alkanesulfonate monooxygenase SsuD/methylene tetrahydromethanopterin reductase-like flavin-dependent oxidoreductase (luciferase family)
VRFGVQVYPPRGQANPARAMLAAAQRVEQLGFDAFFIGDHPSRGTDPWVVLGGAAAVTERVMLGSVVNCVFYRSPSYLARLAADLDQLSGGRLMLGLGIGWDAAEFRALDKPFLSIPRRQAALDEAVTIINGLWGPEPFSFQGEHFAVEAMRVNPPPVQRPRPPLMIAGGGERGTLRQVARYADASNFGAWQVLGGAETPAQIRHKLEVLHDHCEALDRPYEEILRSYFTGSLILAPNQVALAAKLARMFPQGLPDWVGPVYATPEQAIEHYQERVEAGIQYFVVQLIDCTDEETLELLAQVVMPQVG